MSRIAARLSADLANEESRIQMLQGKVVDIQAEIRRCKEKIDYLRSVLAESGLDELPDEPGFSSAEGTASVQTQLPIPAIVPTGPYTNKSMIEVVVEVLRSHGPELKLEEIIRFAKEGGYSSESSNVVGAFSSALSKYRNRTDALIEAGSKRGMYRLKTEPATSPERSAA